MSDSGLEFGGILTDETIDTINSQNEDFVGRENLQTFCVLKKSRGFFVGCQLCIILFPKRFTWRFLFQQVRERETF